MKEEQRPSKQLQRELEQLRQRVAELKQVANKQEQAEEALREGEKIYRDLVENLTEVIYAADSNGIITFIGPAVESLIEYTPSEVIGSHFEKYIHQGDLPRLEESFASILSGVLTANEYRVLTKSGEIRWVRTSSRPTYKGNRVVGVHGMLSNITKWKQTEEALARRVGQLQFIGEVARKASSFLDRNSLLSYAATAIQQRFGYYQVDVFLVDKTQGYAVFETSSSPSVVERRKDKMQQFKVGKEGMIGWVANTGEPLLANDVSREPRYLSDELLPDIRSELAVPLKVEDQIIGVLDIDSDKLEAFDEEEIFVLQTLANQLAIALGNARLYEETRQLAAFNKGIVENVVVGISVEDADGNLTFLNPAAADLLGYPIEELIGQHWTTVVPGDQQAIVQEVLKERSAGMASSYELEIVRKDGCRRCVLVSGSPRFEQGRFAGVQTVFTDITTQKQAEKSLAESEARYRSTINAMNDFIHVVDRDLRLILFNEQFRSQLCKLDIRDDPTGRELFELLPFLPNRVQEEYKQVFETGRLLITEEQTLVGRDTVWSETRKTPILDDDGKTSRVITIIRDITARKHVEKALAVSEARYREIFENAPFGIWISDEEGTQIFANQATLDLFGVSDPAQLVGSWNVFRDTTKDEEPFRKGFQRALAGEIVRFRQDLNMGTVKYKTTREGAVCFFSTLFPIQAGSGGESHIVVIQEDITAQVRAEEEIHQLSQFQESIIENANVWLDVLDENHNVLIWNNAAEAISGYSKEEVVGHAKIWEWLYPDDAYRKALVEKVTAVVEKGETREGLETTIHCKNNQTKVISWHERCLVDEKGNPIGSIALGRDITERKRVEEQLAYMATHDTLTGLPNRQAFSERLDLELDHAHRNQRQLAVMMLDLDHFKKVNDTLGHSVGDKLLQAVGKRLTGLRRKSDTVARLGGDEFMLILPEIAQYEDAERIAQQLLQTVWEPLVIDGRELRISTSIGVVLYPEDADDAETLVRNADIAMYRAKEMGRNTFQRYAPS